MTQLTAAFITPESGSSEPRPENPYIGRWETSKRLAWDQGFAAAIAATTTELRAMSDEWLAVEAADYIERLVPLWRDER